MRALAIMERLENYQFCSVQLFAFLPALCMQSLENELIWGHLDVFLLHCSKATLKLQTPEFREYISKSLVTLDYKCIC